jgi:hypothetical protein
MLVAAATSTTTSAKASSCHGKPSFVNGKRTCLHLGQRCKRAYRSDYLLAGLDCVREGRHRVLRRASLRALRRGRVLDLPVSGRPTFRQALWDFDATVHPLPGVNVPRGAVGVDRSGTSAIKSLIFYKRRLKPRQRAILRSVLRPQRGAVLINPSAPTASIASVPTAGASAGLGDLPTIAAEAVGRLQAHGMVFTHQISLSVLRQEAGDELAHTEATWLEGTGSVCAISVRPSGTRISLFGRRTMVLHELMHCASAEQCPTVKCWHAQPAYLDEGLPTWAAYRVSVEWQGGIDPKDSWWRTYLGHPELNLLTRSYDAEGWWSLLEHLGVDLWKLQPALVKAAGNGDSSKPFALARQAAPSSLVGDWGATLATRGSLGPRWNLDGPAMPPRSEPRAVVGNGGTWGRGVDGAGAYESRVDLRADVIRVFSTEHVGGYLRDAVGTELPIPQDQRYCTKEEGCQCPSGAELPFDHIAPGEARIGFADETEGAGVRGVRVAGRSLDTFCERSQPGKEGGGGGGGQRIEVHQSTPDGKDRLLASFSGAGCRLSSDRGQPFFTAHARNGRYTLDVRVEPFNGFGRQYALRYGSPKGLTDFVFEVGGQGHHGQYTNLYVPPNAPPGGGAIRFAGNGDLALGFTAAFNYDFSASIAIAGGLDCHYPRPG